MGASLTLAFMEVPDSGNMGWGLRRFLVGENLSRPFALDWAEKVSL